jgi:hypothetical protein
MLAALGCRGAQHRAALECEAALDAFPTADARPNDYKANDIASALYSGCASLVRDPGCHKAFVMAASQTNLAKLQSVVDACRAAYCNGSPPEPIDVCTQAPKGRAQIAASWGEMIGLIFIREGGDDVMSLAQAFQRATKRIPHPPPPMLSGSSPPIPLNR